MSAWWAFLSAFGISLLGSLPFGMINLNVLATAVHRGARPALVLALGATLVEGVQLTLVLFGYGYLASHSGVEKVLQWIAVPVFLGLSVHYFRARPVGMKGEVVESRPFWKGVGLSLLNVLVYPFWFLWLGFMHFPVEDHGIWPFLVVGAVSGAYTVMAIFTGLGRYIEQKSDALTRSLNRIIAVIFLILGLWQLGRLIWPLVG